MSDVRTVPSGLAAHGAASGYLATRSDLVQFLDPSSTERSAEGKVRHHADRLSKLGRCASVCGRAVPDRRVPCPWSVEKTLVQTGCERRAPPETPSSPFLKVSRNLPFTCQPHIYDFQTNRKQGSLANGRKET
jgi:hypothetical protein